MVKSSFKTPLIVEVIDARTYMIAEPFEYHVGTFPSDDFISVPIGFITDFASIPRLFWSIMPPDGIYAKAAVIHDYLYDNALRTKKEADNIFYEAMGVLNVPKWQRCTMYIAVKFFGRGNYKEK
ncbi:MAG: DUF1353 domain-containing protein [Campylobacterales bacterium]|nr:DUF1353 domain-containing protein [Campylobacterales bacterium]